MTPDIDNVVVYDIETYPNVFTCVMYAPEHDSYLTFEVSERRNDFSKFVDAMDSLQQSGCSMVGYNSQGFDYPVIHEMLRLPANTGWEAVVSCAREKCDAIIATDFNDRFAHIVWPKDQHCYQIDLFTVWHFDNTARATSLKALEFAMRCEDVGDLPFDPELPLAAGDIEELLAYNKLDVEATFKFYEKSREKLEFRRDLGVELDKDLMNASDSKIGSLIFIKSLEDRDKDSCFEWVDRKRKPRQTHRANIDLSIVTDIYDYLDIQREEFVAVRDWLSSQTIRETKGVFTELPFKGLGEVVFHANLKKVKGQLKNINVVVDGVQFDFGTGGLHACNESGIYETDDDFVVVDIDVTSFYPSIAIQNSIYPQHLGMTFCEVYEELRTRRVTAPKGSLENAALKLALNSVFGNTNNQYSPFYDPLVTMAITIGGQLLLCKLCELLLDINGLTVVQVNTDGVTVHLRREQMSDLKYECEQWEELTGLGLEQVEYSRMFVRDVNSYIGEFERGGKVKLKGAYNYNVDYHQNHSALVVAKAAEAHLLHGTDISDFIRGHDDSLDFAILAKCDRNSTLNLELELEDFELQRNNRVYVSHDSPQLVKVMPPIRKTVTKKLMGQWKKLGFECDEDQFDAIKKAMLNIIDFTLEDVNALGRTIEDTPENREAIALCQPVPRRISQLKGVGVTVINKLPSPLVLSDINYQYYIEEAQKLVSDITE